METSKQADSRVRARGGKAYHLSLPIAAILCLARLSYMVASMTNEKRSVKTPYALIEPNFILNDANYYTLSAPAKAFYIALWCLARNERSEAVRRPSASYGAVMSSSYGPHVSRIIQECVSHHLIEANEEWIVIFGVAKKHNKINIRTFPGGIKEVIQYNTIQYNTTQGNTREPIAPEKLALDPRIKQFIDFFYQTYHKTKGKKYLVQKQDGPMVKKALGTFTLEELKARTPEFLADPLSWQGDKPNHSISIFVNQINRYGKTRPVMDVAPEIKKDCPDCHQKFAVFDLIMDGDQKLCRACWIKRNGEPDLGKLADALKAGIKPKEGAK